MKSITVDSKWIVLALKIPATMMSVVPVVGFVSESQFGIWSPILLATIVSLWAVWSKPSRRIIRWTDTVFITVVLASLIYTWTSNSSEASVIEKNGAFNTSMLMANFTWLMWGFINLLAIWWPTKFDRSRSVASIV